MSWFENMKRTFHFGTQREVPGGLWVKCTSCGAILLKERVAGNLWVCDKCDYHFSITPKDYIALLIDEGTFSETNGTMRDVDFLDFVDTKKYYHRLRAARADTGEQSAIKTGTGKINGSPVVIGIMDFRFIGGSISSVVGEKIVRAVQIAISEKCPFIIITQSGGARMQESTTALMQMAKTAAAIGQLSEAKLPYIVILTNPTTGGATASFAMLGDVHLAEPKALIGFAGPRVIQEAMKCDLPEGFQKSEFLMEHGFCDRIVSREDMKEELSRILHLLVD
jgi:acetyl-CoA carboxylase carboxyl transferase subunit beta